MRYSSNYKVHPGVRARDLPALMELYELNYIRLRQLVPDMDAIQEGSVSCVEGAPDLYFNVLERSRYTTTFHLSYRFNDTTGEYPAPDLEVRIYHDAQVAEVLAYGRQRTCRGAEYDRFNQRYCMEIKWQVNRFLHKWLGYCLHQGHVFSPTGERRSDALQDIELEKAIILDA